MLKALRQRLRGPPRWAILLAWSCMAAAALAGMALAIQRMAEREVQANAEHMAQAWGHHVATSIPDLDLLLLGEMPSAPAQGQLLSLRSAAGVFRFKIFDAQGRLLVVSDSLGTPPRPEDHRESHSALARQAARLGQPQVSLHRGDGRQRPAVYSEAYVPLRLGGATAGVVEFYLDQSISAVATATSFRNAAGLAGLTIALCVALGLRLQMRHAREARHARERAAYAADHDLLTGTLNRARFRERALQVFETPPVQGLAMLWVTLDGLGALNERHGPAAGDEALREATRRLQGVLQGADLLGRVGGDTFAVLQRHAPDVAAVRALAQRIVQSQAAPLPGIGDGRPMLSACVGAARLEAQGDGAELLMHKAKLALQRAQAAGLGNLRLFDPQLDRALQAQDGLAQELREAIDHGALRLHYQPLLGRDGHTLHGYEALARWPHAVRGFIPPMEFIALAEETGQIEALGRWVIESACREAARWPDALSVAVNLSSAQFRQGTALLETVRGALAAAGLPARRLELEITESLLMNHTEQVLATLQALQALGVRIAMDDFGTGFSSLAYLWRFPFDKLKIDRAFTQGLGVDAKVDVIMGSIVSLAHALAIRVNAEGVETEAQRQALCALGCDELQGFLLGRPQPPEQLLHRQAAAEPAPELASSAA